MAGIYLHIPFCRQACHYCDFHFSTTMHSKSDLLAAMHTEIRMRKHYVHNEQINTIYFGGGTPSLLDEDDLKRLLDEIFETHQVAMGAEITLEANPDDLDKRKIKSLHDAGINRLSIGIQSFRDEDLQLMNRVHRAEQSEYAVKASQDAGFENITIDLIYSIPGLAMSSWQQNLEKAMDLEVQHISAYSLTIEPKTVFGHRFAKGLLTPVDESLSQDQFLMMVETFAEHGYRQYEVSNFGKTGFESKHNSSYWKGEWYTGFGPSAHSFDGKNRQWNVANNQQYIRALSKGELLFEREELTPEMRLNEYLMTGLRTIWGVDLQYIRDQFGVDIKSSYSGEIEAWIAEGKMKESGSVLTLTSQGFLFADRIPSDLFIVA